MLRRCNALLSEVPSFRPRYELAKHVIRIFRRPAFYEMSQRCNLWCEGCYYFENEDRLKVAVERPQPDWQDFFEAEKARGVSMAYFVGAEPALEQQRLLAATKHLKHGKIGTNGTIRIDPDIAFRIGISVWGDDETDTDLRGGSVLGKAMRNYAGDDRAVMLFTLSPWNLHTVPDVMKASQDHGLAVTFNLFSPTQTYLEKIAQGLSSDEKFFRIAPEKGAPSFTTDELARASDVMTSAMEDFPDMTLCTPAFRDLITQLGPMFDIDPETNIARDCGSRIQGALKYFSTNLQAENVKCCTPNVDCKECRLYSGAWSSQFIPSAQFLQSAEMFEQWLDMMEMLGRVFIYPLPDIYQTLGSDAE
ncbi:hypothetical protein [Shimia sp. SK013]|uniref:hypothetical protein n=1 Tax=Shimia sp. SK013 TaxID=1389006 RepID=UPI0006B6767B|nr:hypothetical protein [Shimia sp. SK013]